MKTNMRILAAYGAGGFGREVLELGAIINKNGNNKWNDFIFIDDAENIPPVIDHHKVYRYEEAKKYFGESLDVVIAVGEPRIRQLLFQKVKNDGINMPTLINPTAFISETAVIGAGSIIRYGSSVFAGAIIGDNVCVNGHTNIGHDTVIDEGCMISALVNIAGSVHIGSYSYIAMNACIRELISIGKRAVVSMGSIIASDMPDYSLSIGNPPKLMKISDEYRVFNYANK